MIDPVPPYVPVIVTRSPTNNEDAPHENAPLVFVITMVLSSFLYSLLPTGQSSVVMSTPAAALYDPSVIVVELVDAVPAK